MPMRLMLMQLLRGLKLRVREMLRVRDQAMEVAEAKNETKTKAENEGECEREPVGEGEIEGLGKGEGTRAHCIAMDHPARCREFKWQTVTRQTKGQRGHSSARCCAMSMSSCS